jgi:hypothetical protein
MGGMIGGAILGALVNKIQGKDWKRGALFGGIGGGLGSVLSGSKFMPAAGAKGNWLQNILFKQGGPGNQLWSPRFPAISMLGQKVSPIGLAGGAAAAYMMGDPEGDRRKQEEFIAAQNEKDKEKKLAFYSKWFTNPWTGESMFNEGGIVNARPGYYNGGSATLDYTDPDLYTPTGEGSGPSSNPIQQIPLEPEPSFTDEFDELELAGLSDEERGELQSLMSLRLITPKDDPKYPQIEMRIQELMGRMGQETAMSEPHPMEGWHDMYTDQINSGEFTGTFDEFMEMIRDSDFTPDVARGGLMSRPGYADAGPVNIHPEMEDEGYTYDIDNRKYHFDELLPEDEEERRRMLQKIFEANLPTASPNPLEQIFNEARFNQAREKAGEDRIMVDDLKDRLLADNVREAMARRNPMAFRAQGGLMSRPGYANAGPVEEDKRNPFEMKLFGKKFLGLRGLLYKYGLLDPTSELNERLTRGGREAADEMFGYMDKAQGGRVGMYGGGMEDMDLTQGGASFGPGTGTSDDIPAMLSDGEFVVTANAVKNLGGGDRMLGAKRMYSMMNSLDPNSQTPAEMDTTGIA